ncbi:MAG: hypothetical protein Kow0049_10830 [Stanieria sp.]
MQRLLIASLSTLVLAINVPTYANEVAANSSNANPNVVEITPFNLVHRGYQGSLPGKIPSNGAFYTAVNSGKIKAVDLVQSAIAFGRLSQDKLNDKSYLRAVQTQLDNFKHN